MKFYGIEMKGNLTLQKVSELPTFDATRDEGRLVYVENDEEVFIGTSTEWRNIGTFDTGTGDIDIGRGEGEIAINHDMSEYYDKKVRKLPNPCLVLSFDDGRDKDYTKTFPILQTHNVPGVFFVCSGLVGSPYYLTNAQLKEMYDEGHEIGNHGKNHKAFHEEALTSAASIGDTEVYIDSARRFGDMIDEKGYTECVIREYETEDGEIIEEIIEEIIKVVDVLDTHSDDSRIVLESGLKNSYTTSATVQLTFSEMEYEIYECKRDLRDIGIYTKHFAWPYGGSCSTSRQLVQKFHDSARSTRSGLEPEVDLAENYFVKTYNANAVDFDDGGYTDVELSEFMDDALAHNNMVIFYGHSSNLSEDRIEFVINEAKSKGLDIVTMEEAFKRHGNLFEVGDFSGSITGVSEIAARHLAISRLGFVQTGRIYFAQGGSIEPYLDTSLRLKGGKSELSFYANQNRWGQVEAEDNTKWMRCVREGGGFKLKSPNGTDYKVYVDDDGNLTTEQE